MPTPQEKFKGNSGINLPVPNAAGYNIIQSDNGVVTFQKEYQGYAPDFVTVVNLKVASIKSIIGNVHSMNPGTGAFGGNNVSVFKDSLEGFWDKAKIQWGQRAYGVLNGAFFDTNNDPAKLAFPFKKEGQLLSDGYGTSVEFQNPFQIRMFSFDDIKNETVDSFNSALNLKTSLYSPNANSDIVAALDPAANKGINNYVGRTFIGLIKPANSATYDIACIFNSSYASQPGARDVLVNHFSCDSQKVIMFDGGGSTQLIIKDTQYISSSRSIPHAFVILAGVQPVNPNSPFSDVPVDSWFYPGVKMMYDKGYMNGYPDNTFKPNNTITRAEFCTVMKRMLDDMNK